MGLRSTDVLPHHTTMNTSHRTTITDATRRDQGVGILHALRALTPHHHISLVEALRLAEQQADLLRELLAVTTDAFPIDALGTIPRVHLETDCESAVPATRSWDGHSWHIRVRANLTSSQQATLALHQLKHIIDHPVRAAVDDPRPFIGAAARELVADHFAACALIPHTRLSATTTADPNALAARFDVDPAHLERRIRETGLITPVTTERRNP